MSRGAVLEADERSSETRRGLAQLIAVTSAAALVAVPDIAALAGVPPLTSALALLSVAARIALTLRFPQRSPGGARTVLALAHDLAVLEVLVVSTGEPAAPLFVLGTVRAGLDGVEHRVPARAALGALHTLAPLATIPFFLAAGHPLAAAAGAPLFFAVASLVGYGYTAARKAGVRTAFLERDALRVRLAEQRVAAEHEAMVSNLLSSVGARLHRAVSRTASAPRARVEAELASATRLGLAELRSTLDGLASVSTPPTSRVRTPAYRRWTWIPRGPLWEASPRDLWLSIGLSGAVALVLAVPVVADALGIDSAIAVPVTALFPLWLAVRAVARLLQSERAFVRAADYLATCALGIAICVALPVATGDPGSPLWALALMYPIFNGAEHDIDPSLPVLLLHGIGPLVAIPAYLAMGAPVAPSIVVPLLASLISLAAYHHVALEAREVREARLEREAFASELAETQAERARERIARDLHDSAGASLSLAAVYADLLEQRRGDPQAERALEAAMASAAQQGVEDLRAMLEGLAPEAIDLEGVARLIETRARRLAGAAGVALEIVRHENTPVRHAAGYALLRIAQEALSNAVRHARPRSLRIELGAEGPDAILRVGDDGPGFDPTAPRAGRGLGNMRRRAEELGGELAIESGPGGTTITARVPRA